MQQPEYKRHYNPTLVKQHIGPNTTHSIYHFENGYGASVIPEYNLNMQPIEGELELAVVRWDDNDFHLLHWDDPIMLQLDAGDNPVRHITQQEVDELLDRIAAL